MQKCIFINYSDILYTRKCHFINVYVVYQPPTADANGADRGRERCGPRTRTVRTADANGADCGRER